MDVVNVGGSVEKKNGEQAKSKTHLGPLEPSFFGCMFELFSETCFIMFRHSTTLNTANGYTKLQFFSRKAKILCFQRNNLVAWKLKLLPAVPRHLKHYLYTKLNSDWMKYVFTVLRSGKTTAEPCIAPWGFICLKNAACSRILKGGGKDQPQHELLGNV